MNRKRILSVAMAVVLLITTAFYYAPRTFAHAVASETDAEKETPASESEITFDRCYNDVAQAQIEDEGLDFSTCELFVKANAETFTPTTTVQEVSDTTYILKFVSEEETRSAYTYYYDKAQSIEANEDCFTISLSPEERTLSILIADHDKKVSDAYIAIMDAIQGDDVENIYVEGVAGQSKFIDAALACAKDAGITVTSQNSDQSELENEDEELESPDLDTEGTTQEQTTEAVPEETEIIIGTPADASATATDLDGEPNIKGKWKFQTFVENLVSVYAIGERQEYDLGGLKVYCEHEQNAAIGRTTAINGNNVYMYCGSHNDASPFSYETGYVSGYYVFDANLDQFTAGAEGRNIRCAFWDKFRGGNPNIKLSNDDAQDFSINYLTTRSKYTNFHLPDSNNFKICRLDGTTVLSNANGCVQHTTIKVNRVGDIYRTEEFKVFTETSDYNDCIQARIQFSGAKIYYKNRTSSDFKEGQTGGDMRVNDGETVYFEFVAGQTPQITFSSVRAGTNEAGYYIGPAYRLRPISKITRNSGTRDLQPLLCVTETSVSLNMTLQAATTELSIVKSSAMPEITDGNACYSLEGAVYSVYEGNSTSGKVVAELVTDNRGTATVSNLAAGDYTIKEKSAPKGFAVDTKEYHVTTGAIPVTLRVTDHPTMDPVSILLTKKNKMSQPVVGAQYIIKYYKGVKMDTDPAAAGVPLDRSWIFKTDETGKIRFSNNQKWFVSGDEFYVFFGATALPEGTVTIQETSAPTGYVLDPDVYVRQITPGVDASISTFNEVEVTEDTIRGDLSFTKVNEAGEKLANVKFSLTNTDTGESHIIWTDENGYYSTSSDYIKHSKDTNNDKAGSGIWFGEEDLDDTIGALPYGTYSLKELRCEANKDKYKDIEAVTFSVTENKKTYNIGSIINEKFPTLKTTVRDSETGTNVASLSDTFNGIDAVNLKKLEVRHNYKLTMKAYSKALGTYLSEDTKEFEATDPEMDVEVDVKFDVTDELLGTDVVIFEYLTDEAYPDELVAFEENLGSAEQTIHFPSMGTTFLDDVSNTHIAYPDQEVKHTDKIAYNNLIPGIKCKAKATLKYQDTGDTIVDADGKELVQEVSFIPEEPSGTVDVTFKFNASLLAGKSITAFEEIYVNDRLVMSECDLDNEDQTIHYPSMGTTFLDDVSNTHIAYPNQEVKHTDKIAYNNLIPGIKCKAKATLKYQDTGDTIVDADGKELVQEVSFIPEEPSGTVDVTFKFNASLLAGKSITAFEEIYVNDRLVMSECDLNNEDQTIHYPEIHTTAKDAVSLTHNGRRRHDAVIVDIVDSKNLIPGAKYRVDGVVMDYDTQNPFLKDDGEQVLASVEFTAEKSDSSVEVTFPEIDTIKLLGKSLVCYERLYLVVDDKEYLVAVHEDIEDKDQTVTYDNFVGYIDMHIDLHTGGQGHKVSKRPGTGDPVKLFLLLGAALVSGSVVGVMIYKKKKGDKRHED